VYDSVNFDSDKDYLYHVSVDTGLWFSKAHRQRDDRLCSDTLVSGSGNHAELDAL